MGPEEVRASREALGLTQQELADALGLGGGVHAKDSVRNWERDKRPISGPARVAIRLMLKAAGKKVPKPKPSGPPKLAIVEPTIGKGAAE